jgi:hypothetical protein
MPSPPPRVTSARRPACPFKSFFPLAGERPALFLFSQA